MIIIRKLDGVLIAVTGFSLAYFIWLAAPSLSWVNVDADAPIYLAAAKHLIPSHPTGAPAFNLLNAAVLRAFPFGDEAWRLALVSAIPAGLTSGLLYHHTRSLIAPLVFMASGVVASQASVIETYALVTLLMLVMYVWRDRVWVVVAAAFIGLGVHHLIGLALLPILLWYWTNHRERMRPFLVLLLAPLWYLYVPLTYYEGSHWLRGNGVGDFFNYMGGQGGLNLGLALMDDRWTPSSDLLIRMQDVFVIVVSGLAVALIPIARRFRNDLLTWLFILPILHYAFQLPHVTFTYSFPAFAFGGIMAAEGLRLMRGRYSLAVASVAALLIGFNVNAYDIGRAHDPNLSARAFYNELDALPDGAWVYTYFHGWESGAVMLYSLDTGRGIEVFQPRKREIDELRAAMWEAYERDALYHTLTKDIKFYDSTIAKATPADVWPDMVRQQLAPVAPTSEDIDYGLAPPDAWGVINRPVVPRVGLDIRVSRANALVLDDGF